MPTKNEKVILSSFGILIIILALESYLYPEYLAVAGVVVSTYYPYRSYSIFLGVLGAVILVLGLALPTKTGYVFTYHRAPTKPILGQEKIFCKYCGAENLSQAIYCYKCGKAITRSDMGVGS